MQRSLAPSREQGVWEIGNGTWPQPTEPVDREARRAGPRASRGVGGLEPGDPQLRRSATGADLPIGTDAAASPARTVRDRHIKTVLNLGGPNPRESWYRDERGGHAGGGGHAGRHPAVLVRLDVADPVAHAGSGARHLRLPLADSLRLGLGTHRPGLGGRRAAAALRRPSPMRATSSRCDTCTSGSETAESWRSSSISTRTGCAGTGSSIGPRSFAAGSPRDTGPASRAARSGLTIRCRWWSMTRPRRGRSSLAGRNRRGDRAEAAIR